LKPFVIFFASAAYFFGGTHADAAAEASMFINIKRAASGKAPPPYMIAVNFYWLPINAVHFALLYLYGFPFAVLLGDYFVFSV